MAVDYILEITGDVAGELREQLDALEYTTGASGSFESEDGTWRRMFYEHPEDRAAAAEAARAISGAGCRLVDQEREDWVESYQQSLRALEIGRRFVVAPDPSLIEGTGRIALVIPQEHAFGTGSHETTALCIGLLEDLPVAGARTIDIGTGSGILAIAMVKLGAAVAVAIDNDPEALPVLRDNLVRNGVTGVQVPAWCGGPESAGGRYAVAVMNIIPEVIIPLLPGVVALLEPGAWLVLSGILVVRRDDVVRAAASNGLVLHTERSAGEWWAGVFRSEK